MLAYIDPPLFPIWLADMNLAGQQKLIVFAAEKDATLSFTAVRVPRRHLEAPRESLVEASTEAVRPERAAKVIACPLIVLASLHSHGV